MVFLLMWWELGLALCAALLLGLAFGIALQFRAPPGDFDDDDEDGFNSLEQLRRRGGS